MHWGCLTGDGSEVQYGRRDPMRWLASGLCAPPPPPHTHCDCLTNVVRHDVLFSGSDTMCVLRFNQVWHRE